VEWQKPDLGEFMTVLKRNNIINFADEKAKRKQSIIGISEETIEAILMHGPLLLTTFHIEVACAQYEYRQELEEVTVADGLIVHYNVPQRCLTVLDSNLSDNTFSVPLGLLLDLYNLTNINLNFALTYEYECECECEYECECEDEDMIDIRYLHTDSKTAQDMIIMKEDYLERLINNSNITLVEAQNYLARQLMYFRNNAIDDLTLNFAWSVASELASPDTNGMHSFFVSKPENYKKIQEDFQIMQPKKLYEILSDKLSINDMFEELEDFMLATQEWIKQNKEKVMYDVKYAYAKIISDRYDYDFFLAEQEYAKS